MTDWFMTQWIVALCASFASGCVVVAVQCIRKYIDILLARLPQTLYRSVLQVTAHQDDDEKRGEKGIESIGFSQSLIKGERTGLKNNKMQKKLYTLTVRDKPMRNKSGLGD